MHQIKMCRPDHILGFMNVKVVQLSLNALRFYFLR
ncbi:hypothetical protein K227x_58430 [Rubripirellula lacrimiformis]|uniref:Uncharacterized protein n=1 Tax=Rubripirellula lacrimiformis TaxID=1930273 RepID=A0A517NJV9_9BACT|nr:hypothetical protein K227x_58430 [Rubripirellula lacrimiformis]